MVSSLQVKEHNLKRFKNMNEICKLIRLYHANECLWNPKSAGYYNLALKENAWHRIWIFFKDKFTMNQLKLQMLSLRCYYDAERTIMKNSKLSGYNYMPRNSYFEKLKFLNDLKIGDNLKSFKAPANVCDDQISCIVEDAFLLSNSENRIHSEQVDLRKSFTLDNNLPESFIYSKSNSCLPLFLSPSDIEVQQRRILSGNDEWYEQTGNSSDNYPRHARSSQPKMHRTQSNYSNVSEHNPRIAMHRNETIEPDILESHSNVNMPQFPDWNDSQQKRKVLTGKYRSSIRHSNILNPNRCEETLRNNESITRKIHHKLLKGKAQLYEHSRSHRDVIRKRSGQEPLNPNYNPFNTYLDENNPTCDINDDTCPVLKRLQSQKNNHDYEHQNQYKEESKSSHKRFDYNNNETERKSPSRRQNRMQTSNEDLLPEYGLEECEDNACPVLKRLQSKTKSQKNNHDYEHQNQYKEESKSSHKRFDYNNNETERKSPSRRQNRMQTSSEDLLPMFDVPSHYVKNSNMVGTSRRGHDSRLICPAVKRSRGRRNEFDDDQAEYLCPAERRKQRSRSEQPPSERIVECPAMCRGLANDDQYEPEYRNKHRRRQRSDDREKTQRLDSDENSYDQYKQNRYGERTEPRQRRQRRGQNFDEYNARDDSRNCDRPKSSRHIRDRTEVYPNDQEDKRRYRDNEYGPSTSRRQRNSDRSQNDCDACCRTQDRNKPEYSEYTVENFSNHRGNLPRNTPSNRDDHVVKNNDSSYQNDKAMLSNQNVGYANQGEMVCLCNIKAANVCEAAVETDIDMSLNLRNGEYENTPQYQEQDPVTDPEYNSQIQNQIENDANVNASAEDNKQKVINRAKKVSKLCRCTPAIYPNNKNKLVKPPAPAAKSESGKNRSVSPNPGKFKSKRTPKVDEDASTEFQANKGRQRHNVFQENSENQDHNVSRKLSGCDYNKPICINQLGQSQPSDGLAILCSFHVPTNVGKRTIGVLNDQISNFLPLMIRQNFKQKVKSLKNTNVYRLSESRWRHLLTRSSLSKSSQHLNKNSTLLAYNPFHNIDFNASKREIITLHPPVQGFRPSKYSFSINEWEMPQNSE